MSTKSSKPADGSSRDTCAVVSAMTAPTPSNPTWRLIERSAADARSGRSAASTTMARGRMSSESSSWKVAGSSHRSSVRTCEPRLLQDVGRAALAIDIRTVTHHRDERGARWQRKLPFSTQSWFRPP